MRHFSISTRIGTPPFLELGGFDAEIASGEDQDLALRHTARGGTIVFLPEARTVHRDGALDLRSYGRRVERGSEGVVAFCRRHPDWPDNVLRDRINGDIRWGREPVSWSVRKLHKRVVAFAPVLATLTTAADRFEHMAPDSPLPDRVYRLVLGAHILRGDRHGLETSRTMTQ